MLQLTITFGTRSLMERQWFQIEIKKEPKAQNKNTKHLKDSGKKRLGLQDRPLS